MPFNGEKLQTPSGKIELYSKTLDEAGMSPLPTYNPVTYSEEDQLKYPLQVLTVKSTRNFLNSSHGNVEHLLKKEGPPLLDIHPDDAAVRKINNGQEVEVFNSRGRVILTARVAAKVRSGVVCMPQGYWPSLLKGGSSANALTSERLTDMGEGPAFQEAIAEVRALV